MSHFFWCALMFRIVLPTIIIVVSFYRPSVSSYIYLLFGLYMPFYSVPSKENMNGGTKFYMKTLIIACILVCSSVVSFYFLLYFPSDQEYDMEFCGPIETFLRTVGIVGFNDLPMRQIINWLLPDAVMLLTTVLLYFLFKRLTTTSLELEESETVSGLLVIEEMKRKAIINLLLSIGKYFSCLLLCLTAVLSPSVIGAVYYMAFLVVLTYWACNKPLNKFLGTMLAYLVPFFFFHITFLYIYQFQYFQDLDTFKEETIWARLLGLASIKTYKSCYDPRIFIVHSQRNSTYALPYFLYFLHHISVSVARQILQAKDGVIGLVVASCRWTKEKSHRKKWVKTILRKMQNEDLDKATETEEVTPTDKYKGIMDFALKFVFNNSPVLANFLMMIWAIAYVCWKSLGLLILADLVWLMPSRRQAMLLMSPIMALIMHIMLFGAYLYSLKLTENELPSKMGAVDFRSGIESYDNRQWLDLLTKSMIGIIVFVAVRQLIQEKSMRKKEAELDRSSPGPSTSRAVTSTKQRNPSLMDVIFATCLKFLALWWIWVVIVTMIWMEFWSISSLFRIAFVGLAVVFVMTFQLCHFEAWKRFLTFYWWIVMIYAMLNLLVLYMFQIDGIRTVMLTIFSMNRYEEFGCSIWTNSVHRFVALANPIFFQIAVAVQQNYFQSAFNELTRVKTPQELSASQRLIQFYGPKWKWMIGAFNGVTDVLFAILEVHLSNVILFIGWLMCVFDLCAIFAPCVFLFSVACIMGRKFSKTIIYAISCVVQVFIVLRLIYMNQSDFHHQWNHVGHYTTNGIAYNVTLNSADWLGFHESSYGKTYADFGQLIWCFAFVFVVTLDRIVNIRMDHYRKARMLKKPQQAVLFPEVTYEYSHDSFGNMLKFLVNYGFYKLGCEITLLYAAVVVMLRMDAIAILLSFWLLVMFSLKRANKRRLWLPTLLILVVFIPLQYLVTLGWWPSFFERSLTRFWNVNNFRIRLQQFCYLPNMAHPPIKEKISQDYMLLLIMSRQWLAFKREKRLAGRGDSPAGSNESVMPLVDDPKLKNPIPDFTTYTRNYLDSFNNLLFNSWYYVALFATFLAGTMRPSIYSYGFILGASVFLWEGSDMFLRPPQKILLRWNILITYNILVMLAGTISQIFGCILVYESNIYFYCPVLKFFSVGCVDTYHVTAGISNLQTVTSCPKTYVPLGLGWNCISLFFLLFQQRIFKSYYFIHIVNDTKAHTILADRGAELIEESRRKKRERLDNERIAIEKNIKKKMQRIKENESNIEEIRSGIYTHFDQVERDTDIPLLPPPEESDEEEYESYDPMPLTEYFGLYHTTNMDTVLEITDIRSKRKQAQIRKAQGKPMKRQLGPSNDPNAFRNQTWIKVIRFMWGIYESLIVSITGLLDRRTKDFRAILSKMDIDMLTLKEKTNYAQGVRLGANKIWNPTETYKEILIQARQLDTKKREPMQYSIYFKLLSAHWFLLMSYSEWACYLMILLYQSLRSNFISLPILLMTFCWGALTVPNPTKTYWIINIAYSLIMVLIKNFFALGLAPWEDESQQYQPFFPPRLIGLFNTMQGLSLCLLISMFFHRAVLLKLGLWKPYTYRMTSLLTDGTYQIKDGKFVPTSSGGRTEDEILEITTSEVSIGDYFPRSVAHGASKYAGGFRLYIQQLISPASTQIPKDVYMQMFICDLINLLLIVFFFDAFQNSAEPQGIIQFTQSNRVPFSYLVVVLAYMLSMIIDRALYLRKNRFGKLVYHIVQVMFYHLWLFIIDPLIMKRKLRDTTILQAFYLFKALYFLFSAYQIRNGYPTIISYHYLWHGYSMFHKFGYKLYRLIPYFLEIRCLLDWICSDSCLGIPAWFKMEDVTQSLFDQKCQQEYESKWSQPSGQRKSLASKLFVGVSLYAFLVLTVIFPLLLFSLSTAVGVTTRPQRIKMELFMGRAQPIFTSFVQDKDIIQMTENDYKNLSSAFNNIENSNDVFDSFKPQDVIVVKWSGNSLSTWDISPGSKMELLEELHNRLFKIQQLSAYIEKAYLSEEQFTIRLEIHYVHIGNGGEQTDRTFGQNTYVPPLPNKQRQKLIEMVQSKDDLDTHVTLPLIFPKFMRINKEGIPKALALMEELLREDVQTHYHDPQGSLTEGDDDEDVAQDSRRLRDMRIRLYSKKGKNTWWEVKEKCTIEDDNYIYYLSSLVYNDCNYLVLYMFNEKVFSGALNVITRQGILGLYLIYFMMVIQVIRSCRVNVADIWIKDLPNANKLFRKCMEICVARDMKNYELENEIFEEVISIMRSREVVIKLTRYDDNNYDPTFMTPETRS